MAITQVDEANGEVLAKTASRDGTSIGYWRSGQGRPMVLVHGTTADHSRWRTVLPLLQPHATVHAVDRRGRGAVIVGSHGPAGGAARTGRVDAFTRFEEDGWARAAEGYHRFFSPVTGRVVEPLLDAAHVTDGTAVLDVATGPGDLAAAAAARGASVIGVDIAEPVVTLAARLNPGVEFRRADAHDLPFADASFTTTDSTSRPNCTVANPVNHGP